MHFPPQLTKFPSHTCINEGVDSRVGVPEPEDENNPTFGKAHLDVVMMMVIIILDMIIMIIILVMIIFVIIIIALI